MILNEFIGKIKSRDIGVDCNKDYSCINRVNWILDGITIPVLRPFITHILPFRRPLPRVCGTRTSGFTLDRGKRVGLQRKTGRDGR